MRRSVVFPILICFYFFLSGNQIFAQQGVLFTQYLFNGLILNPAYAGYQDELSLNTTYRSQWVGIPQAPKSFSLSADLPLIQDKLSGGLLIVKDQLGAQENQQAEIDLSYRVRLGNSENLQFGVGGNINQNAINPNLLVLLVPETVTSKYLQNTVFGNLRFGLYWYNSKNYAGLSVNDLRNITVDPGNLYIGIHPNYYLTAGNLSPFSTSIQIKSSFLIQEDFINPTNLDLNLFLLFSEKIWFGLSYRTEFNIIKTNNLPNNLASKNSLSGSIQIFSPGNWRFGYAYDYSLNQLSSVSQGSHEVSISYHLNKRKEKDPTRKCYYF